jgi:hypothetical protein
MTAGTPESLPSSFAASRRRPWAIRTNPLLCGCSPTPPPPAARSARNGCFSGAAPKEQVRTATHAFAATADSGADLLVVITPGVERFGYFRLLARLLQGQATHDELLAAQERYDNYLLDSPEWQAART